MFSALGKVRRIAAEISGLELEKLSASTAVHQDMGMAGGDVTEFAEALAGEFGDQVWNWLRARFAQPDEGLSLLFPVMLFWQLVTWPLRRSFEHPSCQYQRLELRHIAAVVEKGEWFDP